MTPDEQHKAIVRQRRDIFSALASGATSYDGIRRLAAARIASVKEMLLSTDPRDAAQIGRLQGQADEAKYWLNIEGHIQREQEAEAAEIAAGKKSSP